MRVPVEWLRSMVDLPAGTTTEQIADRLTAFDLKLEEIIGAAVTGPLVVGRVLELTPEPQKNGKTINWCRVDVGPGGPDDGSAEGRGIVCGAHNFGVGDLVVVALPGAVLPGGFAIAARKTYGHVSDGMICSAAELGLPADGEGIIVLPGDAAAPGDDAVSLLELGGEVLDLEVNPDRAYALSLRGVARDTALAFDVPFVDPVPDLRPATGEAHPVEVRDADACPVFTARVVTGFDPTRPTPRWMARRVEQAGMRSISLAVDVSNYVMLELGQPNHAYDLAKVTGPLVARRARPGEHVTTLDDVDRALDPDDLVIADDDGAVGIAGVMGAARVEIDPTSTDIVIEAAHFDPAVIARSARRHKLGSEASRRNERGVDPALSAAASQRVADLLAELGGGVVGPGLTVVGEPAPRRAVTIDDDLPARISGVPISAEVAVAALAAGGGYVSHDAGRITVTPPTWRFDLTDPHDLVEDVLRVVGYDQVPSVLPTAPAGRGLTRSQQLRRRASRALATAGLVEVKTFPFAGPADLDRLGLPEDDPRRRQVLLANPLSAEEPGLTTTLLTGLLRAAALNVGRGHADVSIVETARVFLPAETLVPAPVYGVDSRPTPAEVELLDAALPDQPHHVGLVMLGQRVGSGWAGPGRAAGWADAISVARRVAESLHVELEVAATEHAPWHPGRCASLSVDGTVIGHAGELHPQVVAAHGLSGRVAAAELDLDALVAAAPALGPRPEFSTYPVAKEDLAFVVERGTPAGRVLSVLRAAHPVIESVRLFDVYDGDQVADGSVSLAFSLRLRAPDRTLGDEEIRTVRDAAVDAVTREFGATLRA
ncbi:phenylalanine--tRNA ligase, beta subunit [Aeromicrobium marinum DSM 15272]|uniref:Phenylalanine--tRNA ligase beta subunit n=1 Tax=Aeromicrobium marinum DSM 15272 TaxID=585531 RepID=E2S9J6_9ACTN|nr:phenylalanine--tRNA ligase subunit beta [Aeromicrobium marinum]EFQ83920.1 phenylalanine--tRNA ligase, beta subunit [Aeromicrobium marinum DSM 15272]